MAQIIVRYDEKCVLPGRQLRDEVRSVIVSFLEHTDKPLQPEDITWETIKNPDDYGGKKISFELTLLGYPSRKEKLNEKVIKEIEEQLLLLASFPLAYSLGKDSPDSRLLTIHFDDPPAE